jgi:hypothetical protein
MREYLQSRVNYLTRVLKENRALLRNHFTESLSAYVLECYRELKEAQRALKIIQGA